MNMVMPSSYNLLVVAALFAIAMLASCVTLNLTRRVRPAQGRVALAWWAAGALFMGICSMHFLGMQAFRLPIEIGFAGEFTLLSWVAAV